MLTERVWEAVVKAYASQMKSAFTASNFVKETFVAGYPKLLGMVDGLLERLVRDTDVKGVPLAIKAEAREQLVSALEPFQTAYLGRSLGRLSDLVNSMFPSTVRGSIPTQEQVSKLVSRIQEEVDVVKSDKRLTLLVLREVGKILQLLAELAEYQVICHVLFRVQQVLRSLFPVTLVFKHIFMCYEICKLRNSEKLD